MSDSSFPVTSVHGHIVVTTPDEIDISNAALLREALLAAAAASPPVIVVDMAGTEYCDSTGLHVLVRALKQTDSYGGQLRLVAGGAGLQRILTVTGIGRLFEVYGSLDQALEAA